SEQLDAGLQAAAERPTLGGLAWLLTVPGAVLAPQPPHLGIELVERRGCLVWRHPLCASGRNPSTRRRLRSPRRRRAQRMNGPSCCQADGPGLRRLALSRALGLTRSPAAPWPAAGLPTPAETRRARSW